MMIKKHTKIGMALLLTTILIGTTGCMNKNNNQANQVRQQGTHMQQAHNQPQSTMDDRVQIANQAVEKITQLSGVKQANVLVTQRNAYVAAVIDANEGKLTSDLENQIAQQVRATDPNIQNVYVSTNPEFVDRVNRYVADVGQGRPISGFFEEFSEMVRRVFPNAR
jgi:YhcN/YlaJ family sporulation lipoprotein